MGFSMAGDQATGLTHVARVVCKGLTIGVRKGPASSEQHGFRSRHVPVFRSTLS